MEYSIFVVLTPYFDHTKGILTLILVFVCTLSFSQFRNTTWGMTTYQVEAAEKLSKPKIEILDESKRGNLYMSQTVTIDNSVLEITYLFENGKLIGGMYNFTPLNRDEVNAYVKLWETTKSNLIKKYGRNYHLVGESLNWSLPNQTIKAFYIDMGNKGFKTINVIYDAIKIKQEDIL